MHFMALLFSHIFGHLLKQDLRFLDLLRPYSFEYWFPFFYLFFILLLFSPIGKGANWLRIDFFICTCCKRIIIYMSYFHRLCWWWLLWRIRLCCLICMFITRSKLIKPSESGCAHMYGGEFDTNFFCFW